MAAKSVPNLVKHCTIAIWRDGGISGGKQERFVSAWNIARSRLVEYGFLQKGSETGPAEKVKLTSKGSKRESFHSREPGGKTKSLLFDQMFRWIEVAEESKKEVGVESVPREEYDDGSAQAAQMTKPHLDQAPKLGHKTKKLKEKSKLGGPFKSVPRLGKRKR
jgi:hypothetical protein